MRRRLLAHTHTPLVHCIEYRCRGIDYIADAIVNWDEIAIGNDDSHFEKAVMLGEARHSVSGVLTRNLSIQVACPPRLARGSAAAAVLASVSRSCLIYSTVECNRMLTVHIERPKNVGGEGVHA